MRLSYLSYVGAFALVLMLAGCGSTKTRTDTTEVDRLTGVVSEAEAAQAAAETAQANAEAAATAAATAQAEAEAATTAEETARLAAEAAQAQAEADTAAAIAEKLTAEAAQAQAEADTAAAIAEKLTAEAMVTELTSRLNDAEAAATAAQTSIDNLTAMRDGLQTQLDVAIAAGGVSQGMVDALTDELAGVNTQLQTANEAMTAAQGMIDTLTADLGTATDSLTASQNRVTELENTPPTIVEVTIYALTLAGLPEGYTNVSDGTYEVGAGGNVDVGDANFACVAACTITVDGGNVTSSGEQAAITSSQSALGRKATADKIAELEDRIAELSQVEEDRIAELEEQIAALEQAEKDRIAQEETDRIAAEQAAADQVAADRIVAAEVAAGVARAKQATVVGVAVDASRGTLPFLHAEYSIESDTSGNVTIKPPMSAMYVDAGRAPAISGWDGRRQRAAGPKAPDDVATVYTNIESATPQKLEYDDTTTTTLAELSTASGNVIVLNAADKGEDAFPSANEDEIRGTINGIPGVFTCGTGCSVIPTVGMDAQPGQNPNTVHGAIDAAWSFESNEYIESEATQDTDFLYFGYWLHMPGDATDRPSFGTFYGASGEAFDNMDKGETGEDDSLRGTATYKGKAAGKYAMRTQELVDGDIEDVDGSFGYFTANASLTANFGGDELPASKQYQMDGEITDFKDGNTDLGFSVTLNPTGFGGADRASLVDDNDISGIREEK